MKQGPLRTPVDINLVTAEQTRYLSLLVEFSLKLATWTSDVDSNISHFLLLDDLGKQDLPVYEVAGVDALCNCLFSA